MIDIIAKKKAVIIITHDNDMTKGMDRVITFDKGKIISDTIQKKYNN
jgi:ABC-type lipoprotein export system ATPase subunit